MQQRIKGGEVVSGKITGSNLLVCPSSNGQHFLSACDLVWAGGRRLMFTCAQPQKFLAFATETLQAYPLTLFFFSVVPSDGFNAPPPLPRYIISRRQDDLFTAYWMLRVYVSFGDVQKEIWHRIPTKPEVWLTESGRARIIQAHFVQDQFFCNCG